MKRVANFSAGPSAIPFDVLKEAQLNLLDYKGNGLSIMESSHRVPMFEEVHNEAISLIRSLYKVPQNFHILFIQGGASLQFAFVPFNLSANKKAEYVDTGVWSSKAIKEAKILGLDVSIVASSEKDNYDHIPNDINFSDEADYGYICSNNTIYGTQYRSLPKCKNLVIDASSDIFSCPVDWSKIGLLFAGAQKNAGPAGVSIAIIREDLLELYGKNVPSMLRYKTYADSNSMFNTPPTFTIYILALTMKWLKNQGGVEEICKINKKKASLLYESIDNSGGFYKAHAQKEHRSIMNVSFKIQNSDDQLEQIFLEEAKKQNMIGLKGHRILGGLRASIYNAINLDDVKRLCYFIEDFAKKRG